MNSLSPDLLLLLLALTGAVIIISALLSGVVQRTGLPQVAVFLALGAVIGPAGLDILSAGVDSPVLRVVATLSLVLVLFTDAVALDVADVRKHRLLSFLILVPGTLMSAVIVAAAGAWLLGLPPTLAVMLGAALASTDPVLLRDMLRRPTLPATVRQALRIESGMNDAVLLPIVLAGIALHEGAAGGTEWAGLGIRVLLLSPVAGAVVAWIGVTALTSVRGRIGVRRDYESLYSLGIAFAAFAAAESIHGSGFLAAFAAGLAVSALDVELCDCFLEYGETTAEMALLFTFVLFGTSLIWTGLTIISGASVLFVLIVLLARPAVFIPALAPVHLTRRDRALIAWFGPRGLSSLLLVLLPAFANIEGATALVTVCCLVVLVSVVLHGATSMILVPPDATLVRTAAAQSDLRPSAPTPAGPARIETAGPEYITLDEIETLRQAGRQVVVVDSRTARTYDESADVPAGSVRISPEFPVADARRADVSRTAVLAVLCA